MTMLYSSDGFDYEGFVFDENSNGFVDKDDPECFLDLELEYEDFCANFDSLFRDAPGFVCTGNSYSRYGLSWQEGPGGQVFTDIKDARDFLGRFLPRGMADIRVDDENGKLSVTVSHHDGSMTMNVRELTNRGLTYYENHRYDLDRREMCEKLFGTKGLSKEINAANRVWGTPLASASRKHSGRFGSIFRRKEKRKISEPYYITDRKKEPSRGPCPRCGSVDCEQESCLLRVPGEYPEATRSVKLRCRNCGTYFETDESRKQQKRVRMLNRRKR